MAKMRINALRVNAGMNQDELACKMGVSKRTIQSWESYKTYPKTNQLILLATVLGCEVSDIFFP